MGEAFSKWQPCHVLGHCRISGARGSLRACV
jgi:hypothetical protein